MNSPAPDRKLLETLWRQRLNGAKLRVDVARHFMKEIIEDFPPKEISTADGHYAYQRAISAETLALREYARILRIFKKLVVDGVIPDEQQWLETHAASESNSKTAADQKSYKTNVPGTSPVAAPGYSHGASLTQTIKPVLVAHDTKTILVAALEESIRTIRRLFAGEAIVRGATSIARAFRILNGGDIDLVLCSMQFADSRMFDFLVTVKSNPRTRGTPILCFRNLSTIVDPRTVRSLDLSCRALGSQFIDLAALRLEYDGKEAEQRFRRIVLSFGSKKRADSGGRERDSGKTDGERILTDGERQASSEGR